MRRTTRHAKRGDDYDDDDDDDAAFGGFFRISLGPMASYNELINRRPLCYRLSHDMDEMIAI